MAEEGRVEYLVISLGGILGANARYVLGTWIATRYGTSFPYGTLVINVSGSFVIGLFLTLIAERFVLHPNWRLFFAVGFLGAYTTFSTFSFESVVAHPERCLAAGPGQYGGECGAWSASRRDRDGGGPAILAWQGLPQRGHWEVCPRLGRQEGCGAGCT